MKYIMDFIIIVAFVNLIPATFIFVISIILFKVFISYITNKQIGQIVRLDGPETHLKKQGTPTAGGVVFVIMIYFITILLLFFKGNIDITFLVLVTTFAFIGFIDDYLKITNKNTKGLDAKYKFLLQVLISLFFVLYKFYIWKDVDYLAHPMRYRELIIPFTNIKLDLTRGIIENIIFVVFMIVYIVGVNNGVNFTDGLDGLCASVSIVIIIFYIISLISLNDYRKVELVEYNILFLFVLIAFLIFNKYPAKLFMGDTGSLFLGAYIAFMGIATGFPIYILIYGSIYFIEVLSVIIQVSYFKKTKGKRFFKMAPIHHHFEKCGFSENKIVILFTVFTIIMCVISYIFMFRDILFK